LSSFFVRKLRNRKPSQFNPDTAGPAAALAVSSGTAIRPVRALVRVTLAALSALLIAGVLAPLAPSPASAAAAPRRLTALRWAERQAGAWYCFGGTGGCFDCSGLVMSAYARAGISIPRTTYGMLASSRLRRIPASQRRRGDLAFYGSGHVELVTFSGTFGAAAPGTQVGWHHPSGWWHPTMYFRVNGANLP
jgi:cell wall-associated NlpC family hydrolase